MPEMNGEATYYPHNDLWTLINYQYGIITEKQNNNTETAITLDCKACLISLAFYVEALINVTGYIIYNKHLSEKGLSIPSFMQKCCNFEKWEKLPYHQKLKSLLPSEQHKKIRESLDDLREFRNASSHAKVSNQTIRSPIHSDDEEEHLAAMAQALENPWEQFATPETVKETFQNVKELKETLLTTFNINPESIRTHGEFNIK